MNVFVVGSPRSGTTVVGSFVGSHPECCDLGEYSGFHYVLYDVAGRMRAMSSPFKDAYLERLFDATVEFAERKRNQSSARFWCDQTPLNLLVGQELGERLNDAVFVLMVRDYRGVVQSLRRANADGHRWAGARIEDSADVWARCYAHAPLLPPDRTIAVSYDDLCASPEATVSSLADCLGERLGVDPALFRREVFASSHATRLPRATIATLDGETVSFAPVPSYDATAWSDGMEARCAPIVSEAENGLPRIVDSWRTAPARPS